MIGGLEKDGITNYGKFQIAEILLFDEELPESRLEMVESYLAHKWSLNESLPNNHPYKLNPPVFENRPEILLNTPYFLTTKSDYNFTIPTNRPADHFLPRDWQTVYCWILILVISAEILFPIKV